MIRVLQIIVALNDGGIERLLYEYYKNFDNDEIQFDFLINDTKEGILEEELNSMGSNIFRYTKFRINFLKGVKDINKVIREGNYDIIHSHLANRGFLSLRYAKQLGIPIRISHSHSAYEPENFIQKSFRVISTPLTKRYSTHLFACGKDAFDWMWGGKLTPSKKKYIMTNGIDVNKYRFSNEKRYSTRDKYGIGNKFAIGCVGRLSDQKNQLFLLEVFKEYIKINSNSCLFLVGTGDKQKELERKIVEYNLEKSVYMLGAMNNIDELLCSFDLYVLASRYEGLPISVIEAQCSGLPCVLSDNITKEVALSDLVTYCPSEKNINRWVKAMHYFHSNNIADSIRLRKNELINEAGYNIALEATKLGEFYKEVIK